MWNEGGQQQPLALSKPPWHVFKEWILTDAQGRILTPTHPNAFLLMSEVRTKHSVVITRKPGQRRTAEQGIVK